MLSARYLHAEAAPLSRGWKYTDAGVAAAQLLLPKIHEIGQSAVQIEAIDKLARKRKTSIYLWYGYDVCIPLAERKLRRGVHGQPVLHLQPAAFHS